MIKKALFELPGGGMLRADAAASYLRMRAAGMPAGGVQVFYRSLKKQAKLFHLHQLGLGPLAAKPTPNAPHVRGVAMDLRTGGLGAYHPSAAHLWLSHGGDGSTRPKPGEKLRSHAFGWRRSVPSERWHYGYDPARDHKRSTDLRGRVGLDKLDQRGSAGLDKLEQTGRSRRSTSRTPSSSERLLEPSGDQLALDGSNPSSTSSRTPRVARPSMARRAPWVSTPSYSSRPTKAGTG